MRSLPSSTSAWLKLICTCGATSSSATCTVNEAGPTIANSGSCVTVKVRVLSGMSRQSSGGVRLISLTVSPGANTTLEGTSTASQATLPWRNPPGSSTATPTISSPVVLAPRVRVKVTGSPSVTLVEFTERLTVGWSSSTILTSPGLSLECPRLRTLSSNSTCRKSEASYSVSSVAVTANVTVCVAWAVRRSSVMGTAGRVNVWICSLGLAPSGPRRLGSQVRT